MDMTSVLHDLCEELDSEEISALKFLCKDQIQRKKLETVADGRDLFLRLQEQGSLDDFTFVAELLFTIKRFDLLKKLGMSRNKMEEQHRREGNSSCKISPYRKFLYNLYEDVDEDNLKYIKFLLKLPRARLDACKSLLDVLLELEKQELLTQDNLEVLHEVLQKCNPQLASKLRDFTAQREGEEEDPMSPRDPDLFSSPEESLSQEESMSADPELLPSCTEDSNMSRGQSNDDQESEAHTRDNDRMSLVTDAAVQYSADTDMIYSMKQNPRGHCLIINNYSFEKARSNNLTLRDRNGTAEDAAKLLATFQWLHFDVLQRDDLTGSELLRVVKEFGARNHSRLDAFVCCVLSHGEKGSVLGADGRQVPIRQLTQPFTSRSCPSLAGKPKLFFIQACQGQERQCGTSIKVSAEEYEADADDTQPDVIPDDSDFLLGMATVEDYQSFRHIRHGSIYIQELCRQLEVGCSRNENILSILTRVNREVSAGVYKSFKQMPEPRYTLTKALILPVSQL